MERAVHPLPFFSGGLSQSCPAERVASHGSSHGNKPEKVVLGLRSPCTRPGADCSPAGHWAMILVWLAGTEGPTSFWTTLAGLSGRRSDPAPAIPASKCRPVHSPPRPNDKGPTPPSRLSDAALNWVEHAKRKALFYLLVKEEWTLPPLISPNLHQHPRRNCCASWGWASGWRSSSEARSEWASFAFPERWRPNSAILA